MTKKTFVEGKKKLKRRGKDLFHSLSLSLLCTSLCSVSLSLSLCSVSGSLQKGKDEEGKKKRKKTTLHQLHSLSLNCPPLSLLWPQASSLFPLPNSSSLSLSLQPCSLDLISFRNVAVVPFPPMSGVFDASGASARAPSTAFESLSEKSGRLRWRSIMLAVSRAEVGLATPRPAMSAATDLGFFFFFLRRRRRRRTRRGVSSFRTERRRRKKKMEKKK